LKTPKTGRFPLRFNNPQLFVSLSTAEWGELMLGEQRRTCFKKTARTTDIVFARFGAPSS